MFDEITIIFLSLFLIMDAFGSMPIFLSLTTDVKTRRKQAYVTSYAVLVAGLVLFVFLFFGQDILTVFKIHLSSLKIAGGMVLVALGFEIVVGIGFMRTSFGSSPAITLIGTPLLTGPGVIATTMIFVQEYGYLVTVLASLAVLGSSWVILFTAKYLRRVLGKSGLDIISRVIGLLLIAIAVELIIDGLKAAF
ncbi:MAG: MarC family protein [Candidatus Bathyarchaeota archaeon]